MIGIRLATEQDMQHIAAIYSHYVLHTAITFDYEPSTPSDMLHKWNAVKTQYPFIVAEKNKEVVAFAYAAPFRSKTAFQWSVESTIYVSPDHTGQAIGTELYAALMNILSMQGFCTVYGVITLPNDSSIQLHKKMGFQHIGDFRHSGYKQQQWHDTAWYQHCLNDYAVPPAHPLPVASIDLSLALGDHYSR